MVVSPALKEIFNGEKAKHNKPDKILKNTFFDKIVLDMSSSLKAKIIKIEPLFQLTTVVYRIISNDNYPFKSLPIIRNEKSPTKIAGLLNLLT